MMMKGKFVWIAALIIALSFVFVGCEEDETLFTEIGVNPKSFEKGLQIRAIDSWAGLDLVGADSGLEFAEGDKIYIRGKMGPTGTQIFFNTNHSGWGPAGTESGGWNPAIGANAAFDGTVTLSAANKAALGTASPKNLRLRGNAAGASFIVFELKYTRGTTTLLDLADLIKDISVGPVDADDIATVKPGFAQAAGGNGNVNFSIVMALPN